jgi:peroxiredoxin
VYASLLALAFAIADEPVKVAEGKPAPDVSLTAATPTGTKEIHLKDFKGKNVVLFFYPKAMTGG